MTRSLAHGDYSLLMAVESASRPDSWYRVLADRQSEHKASVISVEAERSRVALDAWCEYRGRLLERQAQMMREVDALVGKATRLGLSGASIERRLGIRQDVFIGRERMRPKPPLRRERSAQS